MKKKWKKRVGLNLFMAVMLFGVMPTTVQAEDVFDENVEDESGVPAIVESGTHGDNLTWVIDEEGTMTISGEGEMEDGTIDCDDSKVIKVVIESGVTSIGEEAFVHYNFMEEIVIPSSVKKIGDYAFQDCKTIKEIVIPEGVEEIGDYAFKFCGLEKITIPSSVEKIGQGVLADTMNLKEIKVNDENSYYSSDNKGVLYNKDKTVLITVPAGLEGYFRIPDSVHDIEYYAFENSCLESVVVSGSIRSIKDNAFANSNIKDIIISEGVEEIGDYAFYSCGIERITIPSSVKKIRERIFWGCDNLQGVWVENANPYFSSDEQGVLYNKDKTILIKRPCAIEGEFEILDSVKCIGDEAFEDNKFVEMVIPSNVKSIGALAFANCRNLENVTIKEGVSSIGRRAFSNCRKIKELVLPNSVTEIMDYAFYECFDLESLTIGRNINVIGDVLFQDNDWEDEVGYSLDKVKFLGKAPEFADDCFWGQYVTCYYPKNNSSWTKSVRKDYGGDITWKGYEGTRYAPTIEVSNVSSSGKIKLTWSPANGAAKYKVYRSTSKNGSYKLLGTTKGTVFTNTSATAGKSYYYYIKAVDSNGKNAKKSNTVNRVCDLTRPKVKVKLNSNGKPRLTWDKVSKATKYEVYRATSKNGKYSLLKKVEGTAFANTSAKKGKTYYYKVRAIHSKSSANSAYSTVVSIKSK